MLSVRLVKADLVEILIIFVPAEALLLVLVGLPHVTHFYAGHLIFAAAALSVRESIQSSLSVA